MTREDSTALYGFIEPHERELFKRLLKAPGWARAWLLAMLSTFSAGRLAQALVEKDLAALTQVNGVGKKKAERLALELSEKVRDLAFIPEGQSGAPPRGGGGGVGAIALGYSLTAANTAVRAALKGEKICPPKT